MDDFYAARSRTIPPLPWSNIAPPFSLLPIGIEVGDIAKTGISRREADLQIALLGELQTNLEAAIRSLSPEEPDAKPGRRRREDRGVAGITHEAGD